MTESQALDQEVIDESKPITFAPLEWKFFKQEIAKQFADDDLDIFKAWRRARYLAMLEKSFSELKEGKVVKFTDEEWEAFVDEQDLH